MSLDPIIINLNKDAALKIIMHLRCWKYSPSLHDTELKLTYNFRNSKVINSIRLFFLKIRVFVKQSSISWDCVESIGSE